MRAPTTSRSLSRAMTGTAIAWAAAIHLAGCTPPESTTGACCSADAVCTESTEADCSATGGTYQGDDTVCENNATCADDFVLFAYNGGECPAEMTIKDGDPGNVECGVPRSRLFDEDSPLDGSLADSSTGGFGTFPSVDDPDETGMLIRLDGFAVNSNGPRANIVIICLNLIIPPQAGMRRAVKCRITRAAGFSLTPEAQAIVNSGKRNYWSQQARKLAKLEADAASGVDPGAARRADRLRRVFQRKNNTEYDALADGTRYMDAMVEETEKIEIIPPRPGAVFTIYLVFVGDAFNSLGEFVPHLEFMLSRDADADSPMLGDIDDTALVLESIDEVGPVAVVDYANGAFTPNQVDLTSLDNMNPQNAIWITNSSMDDLSLQVPGHPDLVLESDFQVAFNDLVDGGQIVGVDGQTATLNIIGGSEPEPVACCFDGECDEAFTDESQCTAAGGTPHTGQTCADSPCAGGPTIDQEWLDAVGTYVVQGNCPGNGQPVQLLVEDDALLLRNLAENDDVPLSCDRAVATGDNVTAFDIAGHELTLTIQPTGINMTLFQPNTLGSCASNLIQQ